MEKNDKHAGQPGYKKDEPAKDIIVNPDENEMFIKRLAIQRKLLKNFVEPTKVTSASATEERIASDNN